MFEFFLIFTFSIIQNQFSIQQTLLYDITTSRRVIKVLSAVAEEHVEAVRKIYNLL